MNPLELTWDEQLLQTMNELGWERTDLIVYYDSEKLEALYYQKKVQSLIKEDFEDYRSEEEHY